MMLWTAVNSVTIVLLTLALYLTIRQVGLLLAHLGPGTAHSSDQGPRVGENLSPYLAAMAEAPVPAPLPTLLIFATEFCPYCAVMREAARMVARHWISSARLIMVYDSLSQGANGADGGPTNFAVLAHPTLRERLDIRTVPYAVMTDGDGLVLGHGLINNASHIESLLEIKGNEGDSRGEGRPEGAEQPVLPETQQESSHP
jgi:methylamine dehydrogenase accessory protein MauD